MLRAVVAVSSVLACLALPAGALAHEGPRPPRPPNLDCTGVVSGGTYANLIVPSGDDCFLSDATILGNATVESTASLDLENSGTIGGSLFVGSQGSAAEESDWVIHGSALSNGADTLEILGTVEHSVLANDTLVLSMQSATVGGSVVSNRGSYGGAIVSSAIRGGLIIDGTSPGSSGLTATWLIAGPQLGGDEQEIGRSVFLIDNQASIYIFDNHIHRDLVCVGNNPPPTDSVGTETNTVDGRSIGQCSSTTPAPAGVTADSLRADQSRAIGRDLTAPPFKLF